MDEHLHGSGHGWDRVVDHWNGHRGSVGLQQPESAPAPRAANLHVLDEHES